MPTSAHLLPCAGHGQSSITVVVGYQPRGMSLNSTDMLSKCAACPMCPTFLMVPRMPDTVRMEAPSNLATSRGLLNMLCTKAVCLCTLPCHDSAQARLWSIVRLHSTCLAILLCQTPLHH